MYDMSVTLDVSKLSGWLNAAASCRVARGGRGERGTACGARRRREGMGGSGGGASSVQGESQLRRVAGQGGVGGRTERTINMYAMVVTLDVSQLDTSALKCEA